MAKMKVKNQAKKKSVADKGLSLIRDMKTLTDELEVMWVEMTGLANQEATSLAQDPIVLKKGATFRRVGKDVKVRTPRTSTKKERK